MVTTTEYQWLEAFLLNDSLWVNDSLNWDEIFDTILSDNLIWSFFTTPFFKNINFFTDIITKVSVLDFFLIFGLNSYDLTSEFYFFFLWDLFQIIFIKHTFFYYLYISDYQDTLLLLYYYNSELIIPLIFFFNQTFDFFTINYQVTSMGDLISDTIEFSFFEITSYLYLFILFVWSINFFLKAFRVTNWNKPIESIYLRLNLFTLSLSREVRVQYEAAIQVIFLFFFYWTMMIATFDDDKEEVIETLDTGFFYFFLFLILFLLLKYSIHYFAFLEASSNEGRLVAFLTKQFMRDIMNSFGLFLRFFVLLFRLNVYDTLDDFYDSYYIYIGDFDDDEYYHELFFNCFNFIFYDFDNNSDKSFSLEEENDLFFDIFYIYFICWAKFFTFIFFILEEILRLSLAFYISYLIVFEVHAVNFSYIEDLEFKKNN